MTCRVNNGESNIFIKKEDIPQVLQVIYALPGWENPGAPELHRAFDRFGLGISEDQDGNITDRFLLSDGLRDAQQAVFQAIAPFVAPGSYLMFVGEDGAQWAWVFRKNPQTGVVEASEEDVIPVLASDYRRATGAGDERDVDSDPNIPLISVYTRSDALGDGALVDVSKEAKEVGIKVPTALTRAVWAKYVALSGAAREAGCDERGRIHDILWMLRWAAMTCPDADTLSFQLLVVTRTTRASLVTLKATCRLGDNGEPVVTILLPEED